MPEFFLKLYMDYFKLKNKDEAAKCIKETPFENDDEDVFDTKKVKSKWVSLEKNSCIIDLSVT